MYFVHKRALVYQFSCNFQVLLSTFKYWHFERYLLFRATVCVALSSWAKCWRRQRPLDWKNCASSSSSVLHHRGHQSLEKKWRRNLKRVFSLMFFLHFDLACSFYNYKLAYKREDLCQFKYFPIHKRYDSSLLLRFFFILLVNSFPQTFFKAFTCSKQNTCVNIFKTASFS